MGHLVVQAYPEELSYKGTRACKSEAQSGTLLRVVTLAVLFLFGGYEQ